MALQSAYAGGLEEGRVPWVDTAKGLCIILVVMMHATLGVGEAMGGEGFMHQVVAFARPFRMPDFFLVSGLFLARVIDRDWKAYADRRVVHFLYFYLLWLVIQSALKYGQVSGGTPTGFVHHLALSRRAVRDAVVRLPPRRVLGRDQAPARRAARHPARARGGVAGHPGAHGMDADRRVLRPLRLFPRRLFPRPGDLPPRRGGGGAPGAERGGARGLGARERRLRPVRLASRGLSDAGEPAGREPGARRDRRRRGRDGRGALDADQARDAVPPLRPALDRDLPRLLPADGGDRGGAVEKRRDRRCRARLGDRDRRGGRRAAHPRAAGAGNPALLPLPPPGGVPHRPSAGAAAAAGGVMDPA